MFLYIVMPFLGAIIAAVLYIYHNSLEKEDRRDRHLPPTDLQKRREEHTAEVTVRRQQQGFGVKNPEFMQSNLLTQETQGGIEQSVMATQVMAPNTQMRGNYLPPQNNYGIPYGGQQPMGN